MMPELEVYYLIYLMIMEEQRSIGVTSVLEREESFNISDEVLPCISPDLGFKRVVRCQANNDIPPAVQFSSFFMLHSH